MSVKLMKNIKEKAIETAINAGVVGAGAESKSDGAF